MLFPLVLIVVSLVFIQRQQTLPAENMFPEDLKKWCPNTKFCHNETTNQPRESTSKQSDVNSIQCCESCSCSPECGLTRNCCTYAYDQYKLDESLGTVCKALDNRLYTSPDDVKYHMVDKCPNKDITCNTVNVSTWGSYCPVYSKSTGMIYYNSECATCHNQNDTVTFLPFLACPSVAGQYSNVFENVLNGIEDECYLKFMLPVDIDVSRELCYPSMIRGCSYNGAGLYYLKDKCESFNATYHTGSKTYQNVFCFLCGQHLEPSSEKWLEDNEMCPRKMPNRDIVKSSLVVLLDDGSMDKYKRYLSKEGVMKTVCFGNENSSISQTCRPVHCPEAHFHLNGKCEIFGQTWHVRNVQLLVNLTPSNHHDILTVFDLAELTRQGLDSNGKSFIKRPALQKWEMELFYNVFENSSSVRYIMAIVFFVGSSTVRSESFLANIQTSIQSKWRLYIKGREIELKATFNKFTLYQITSQQAHTPLALDKNVFECAPTLMAANNQRFEECRIMNFTAMSRFLSKSIDLFITKSFFCEQVDLDPDEFIYLSKDELYLVQQRKYLGSGEFKVTTTNDGLRTTVRVCLEDIEASNASTQATCLIVALVCHALLMVYAN